MRNLRRLRTATAVAFSLTAGMALVAGPATGEAKYGRYTCRVDEVYGRDGLGQAWKHGTLVFDADAGTLHGAADPGGGLRREGMTRTPTRMFSRLKVETVPSDVSNLHAVQYDPAPPSVTNPIMAWIMIETMDDPEMPRFQFFSTTVRSILSGRCRSENPMSGVTAPPATPGEQSPGAFPRFAGDRHQGEVDLRSGRGRKGRANSDSCSSLPAKWPTHNGSH